MIRSRIAHSRPLPGTPGLAEPAAVRSTAAYYDALARGGRSTHEVEDISGRRAKRFVPFIGSGTGGSSALYGMVCERFYARDFTPRQNFADPGDSTVPEEWPVTYDEMRPWYADATALLAPQHGASIYLRHLSRYPVCRPIVGDSLLARFYRVVVVNDAKATRG